MALGAHELCGQIRQFLSDHGSDPQYRRAIQSLREAESTLSASYDAQSSSQDGGDGKDKASPPDFGGAKDRAKEQVGAAPDNKDNLSPFQKRMKKRDKAAA